MKLAADLLSVYLIRVILKRIARVKERNTKKSVRSHLSLFACIRTVQRKLQVGGFQLLVFLFFQCSVWGEPLAFVQILFNIYMLDYITLATDDMTIVCFFCCFPYIHNRLPLVKLVRCFFINFITSFLHILLYKMDTCTVQIKWGS